VQRYAVFNVLRAVRFIAVEALGREFLAADGALVFLGDLAAGRGCRSGMLRDRGLRSVGEEGTAGARHVVVVGEGRGIEGRAGG
jgi:hypothetical protein